MLLINSLVVFILYPFFLLIAIETMTAKTGNVKSFSVFLNILENAINQVRETIIFSRKTFFFVIDKIRKVHQ
jgi:hypothetical protein